LRYFPGNSAVDQNMIDAETASGHRTGLPKQQ
jgi:hypothetical protein